MENKISVISELENIYHANMANLFDNNKNLHLYSALQFIKQFLKHVSLF